MDALAALAAAAGVASALGFIVCFLPRTFFSAFFNCVSTALGSRAWGFLSPSLVSFSVLSLIFFLLDLFFSVECTEEGSVKGGSEAAASVPGFLTFFFFLECDEPPDLGDLSFFSFFLSGLSGSPLSMVAW